MSRSVGAGSTSDALPPSLQETPSESKRSEATVRRPDSGTVRVSKGTPRVILALAVNSADVEASVDQAIQEFASRGYRSLGVARTNAVREWQVEGVIPLFDPPRADSKSTIEKAKNMGLKVKLITGDRP